MDQTIVSRLKGNCENRYTIFNVYYIKLYTSRSRDGRRRTFASSNVLNAAGLVWPFESCGDFWGLFIDVVAHTLAIYTCRGFC